MKVQNKHALVIRRVADNRYFNGEKSHVNPWGDLRNAKVYASKSYGLKALRIVAEKSSIATIFQLLKYATEYDVRNNGTIVELIESIEVKPARSCI